jgi:hypothetical protein
MVARATPHERWFSVKGATFYVCRGVGGRFTNMCIVAGLFICVLIKIIFVGLLLRNLKGHIGNSYWRVILPAYSLGPSIISLLYFVYIAPQRIKDMRYILVLSLLILSAFAVGLTSQVIGPPAEAAGHRLFYERINTQLVVLSFAAGAEFVLSFCWIIRFMLEPWMRMHAPVCRDQDRDHLDEEAFAMGSGALSHLYESVSAESQRRLVVREVTSSGETENLRLRLQDVSERNNPCLTTY